MKIGYNPLVDFFHVENELLFYEDFIGNFFAGRYHGNIVLDENYVSPAIAKIFRPVWSSIQGTIVASDSRCLIPAGNVLSQIMSTLEVMRGRYWRFDFQFINIPTVNDLQFIFWMYNGANYIYVYIDVIGTAIAISSQQAGGPVIITGPFVNVWDNNPHYVEVVYDGVDQWELYLDSTYLGVGTDVFAPIIDSMRILNTVDSGLWFDQIKCQNYSPI